MHLMADCENIRYNGSRTVNGNVYKFL